MSFSSAVFDAKAAIDAAPTNTDLHKVLVVIADAATRFANNLKEKIFHGSDWANPISYFKEFWAPTNALLIQEWGQVETALAVFRAYIDSVPKDSSEPDTATAKTQAIQCMASVETIYRSQTDSSDQFDKAIANLSSDIANAPNVISKAMKSAGDITANRIVAPLAEGLSSMTWEILVSILKGFWWLILIIVLAVGGYALIVHFGGLSALAAKAV